MWYRPFDSLSCFHFLVRPIYTHIKTFFFYWSLPIITVQNELTCAKQRTSTQEPKNQIAIAMTNIYVILLVSKILDSFSVCRATPTAAMTLIKWLLFLLYTHTAIQNHFRFLCDFCLFARNSKCMQWAIQSVSQRAAAYHPKVTFASELMTIWA